MKTKQNKRSKWEVSLYDALKKILLEVVLLNILAQKQKRTDQIDHRDSSVLAPHPSDQKASQSTGEESVSRDKPSEPDCTPAPNGN